MAEATPPDHRLPDVLVPGLAVVFCGTAAGTRSAATGCYYAGRGNRFWPMLAKTGLTPLRLAPQEFRRLPEFGLGLTDLAKRAAGMDHTLRSRDFDVDGLVSRIQAFRPRILAFNGRRGASVFLGRHAAGPGLLEERIGETLLYVLPSTSGAAAGHWDEAPWHALAALASGAR